MSKKHDFSLHPPKFFNTQRNGKIFRHFQNCKILSLLVAGMTCKKKLQAGRWQLSIQWLLVATKFFLLRFFSLSRIKSHQSKKMSTFSFQGYLRTPLESSRNIIVLLIITRFQPPTTEMRAPVANILYLFLRRTCIQLYKKTNNRS